MKSIKVVIIITIIGIIIIGFSIFTSIYLNKSSDTLKSHISSVQVYTKDGDWVNAHNTIMIFEEEWNKTKKTWRIFLDHFEIDNIDEAFVRVKKYIEEQDSTSVQAEAAVLERYIEHIPEKDAFRLTNIL